MKGIELLSDMFTILVLVVVLYVLVIGLPVSMHTLRTSTDAVKTYTLDINDIHLPFLEELSLINFMDLKYNDYSFRELLQEAAMQNTTETIYLDGKIINLEDLKLQMNGIFDIWFNEEDNYFLILKTQSNSFYIVGRGDGEASIIKKVTYNLFNPFERTWVELYVYE